MVSFTLFLSFSIIFTKTCTPGEYKCSGKDMNICSADGSWKLSKCPLKTKCEKSTLFIMCLHDKRHDGLVEQSINKNKGKSNSFPIKNLRPQEKAIKKELEPNIDRNRMSNTFLKSTKDKTKNDNNKSASSGTIKYLKSQDKLNIDKKSSDDYFLVSLNMILNRPFRKNNKKKTEPVKIKKQKEVVKSVESTPQKSKNRPMNNTEQLNRHFPQTPSKKPSLFKFPDTSILPFSNVKYSRTPVQKPYITTVSSKLVDEEQQEQLENDLVLSEQHYAESGQKATLKPPVIAWPRKITAVKDAKTNNIILSEPIPIEVVTYNGGKNKNRSTVK